MFKLISYFREKQKGATASEYAILIVLIGAVIVTVVAALGIEVRGLFDFNWD